MPSLLNLQLAPLLYNAQDPGCIIHITDIYAENPSSKSTLYSSTKAGLDNLTKGLAKKMAPGIRVNSIQPGPIKFLPKHSHIDKEKILAKSLLPFEGGFLPIYKAIMSIIDNNYITGASIKVDGGRSLGDW